MLGTFVSNKFLNLLDILQAIERMLEAKNISFNSEDNIKRDVNILRKIRAQNKIDNCIIKEDIKQWKY